MGAHNDLIIGLDVGTTKICTVVAEADRETGGVRVLGVGEARSRGLRKGIVIEMSKAVKAVAESVEKAEKAANVEIHSVFAGISGGHIQSLNSRGVAAVEEEEITPRDVERAIRAAKAVSLPEGREILHTIPREFVVDGQRGIREPVGMTGVRLEAEVHIVTGAVSAVQNVVSAINRAGFEVEDIVLETIASGISVLTEEEKRSGVLLIDIGGGTTDFVVFRKEALVLSDVLAVGGDHVTNDVSVAFRLPISQAEAAKISFGTAMETGVDAGEEFEVEPVDGKPPLRFSRRELAHVIGLRMEEIFSLVRRSVDRPGHGEFLGAGVVLTGGGALLSGVVECAEEVFRLPVRLGSPSGFSGLSEVLDNPAYATGTGLARYGYRYRKEGGVSRFMGRGFWRKIADRMRRWFGRD